MVGKLIGRGGDTIKQLQYSSGTKIQIDHDSGGDTKRVTIASASQQGIDKAKREIDLLCADDGADHTEEVQCPQGIVGRIIGRGGETIRALQQASQAHIVVDQNFPEGQPRKVIVTGRQDGVMRATKMIQELINGEPGSAQSIIQKVCACLCCARMHASLREQPALHRVWTCPWLSSCGLRRLWHCSCAHIPALLSVVQKVRATMCWPPGLTVQTPGIWTGGFCSSACFSQLAACRKHWLSCHAHLLHWAAPEA